MIDVTPPGPFSADDGIAIRVRDHLSLVPPDGDGIDGTVVFGPQDCSTSSDGVLCRLVTGPEAGSQTSGATRSHPSRSSSPGGSRGSI